jgi:tRNA threonylcarbamoyl adenosine modification protein (Sua5/YciO/YrdC/YwlC family)
MTQTYHIRHGDMPLRQIKQVVSGLQRGDIAVVPTDSCYALVCQVGRASAIERIRTIRSLGKDHYFTLLCSGLSQLSDYAEMNNQAYRFVKTRTPGPFTFILPATRQVPTKLRHPKRKTIGVRMPDHPIVKALLDEVDDAVLGVSLCRNEIGNDIHEVLNAMHAKVDHVIEHDEASLSRQTTVVDLTGVTPELVREGLAEVDW